MKLTRTITTEVAQDLAGEVEKILSAQGLSVSEAVGLLFHYIKIEKQLPFAPLPTEDASASGKKERRSLEDILALTPQQRLEFLFLK